MKYFFGILFLILVSCSGHDTSLAPPPGNATFADVFPAEINGLKGEARMLEDLGGTEMIYGNENGASMYIYAVRGDDNLRANELFDREFAPVFGSMPNHFTGKINGNWQGSGTESDGRKWYGWVNGRWLFVINGSNQQNYELVVEAFDYIK